MTKWWQGTGIAAALTLTAWNAAAGCETDDECKGDRVCVEGACTAPTSAGCSSDVECPGDKICAQGHCTLPSPPAAQAEAPAVPSPPAAAVRGGDTPPPPPPLPPVTERRGILGLIIAGPIVLGVSWLATIGVTAGLDADGDLIGMSAIPIGGPWAMIADDRTSEYTAALAVSGILQAGGLTMLILGVAIQRDVVVGQRAPIELEMRPLAGPRTAGFAAAGRF